MGNALFFCEPFTGKLFIKSLCAARLGQNRCFNSILGEKVDHAVSRHQALRPIWLLEVASRTDEAEEPNAEYFEPSDLVRAAV